jgi:hypothetical protein
MSVVDCNSILEKIALMDNKGGDGWLRKEMGGSVGRWVAKEGDRWLRREMGG